MEIRLTIDATPTLMDALINFAGALRGLSTPAQHTQPSAPVMTAPMSSVTQTKDAVQTVVTGEAEPSTPPVVPTTPVPTAAPAYMIEDIMRAASTVAGSGKRAEVLELMHQFGVDQLKDLPPERFGDFAAALRGMGGKV